MKNLKFSIVLLTLTLLTAYSCKKDSIDSTVSPAGVEYVKVDYPEEFVAQDLPTYDKITEAKVSPTSYATGGDAGHFIKLRSDRPFEEVREHYRKEAKNKKGWSVNKEEDSKKESDGTEIYLLEMTAENGDSYKLMVSKDLVLKDVVIAMYHFNN